jgi:3-oxoacyl-[acyl-carrier protein] reductase
MKKLNNKVAIVTGGSRGIGKATVELFAAEGAHVAIWDIDRKSGEETANSIDGSVSFQEVNTADHATVEKAAEELVKSQGKIDILINNAGILRDATLKKMTTEQWQQVIDVNLTGVFNCTQVVSKYMSENGYGRIVSAASVVGLYGNFGQSNYVATKAGVIGMTKVWARELGRKGITVNVVAPGFIETEMTKKIPVEVISSIQDRIPARRMGQPREIANAYLFLASEEASYVNGNVLSVDGGYVG